MYPAVAIALARTERDICQELLARVVDPKHARVERQRVEALAHAKTLRADAEQWFKIKSPDLTAGYAEDIWSSLENHVFPKLGDRPIHKLSPRDVIELLKPLRIRIRPGRVITGQTIWSGAER